jgi:antirestriction protein
MFNSEKPQIYVACLAAYNNGYLYGNWVDATEEPEIIHQEIQKMLSKSPIKNSDEWAIHAVEGFGSLRIDENEEIDKVHEIATFISEHGKLGAELIAYFYNLENAKEALENNYHGEYSRKLDFAIQLFDDIYLDSIPDHLAYYIDYEAFSYDIFINDYFALEVDGNVHVFSYL